MFPSVKTRFASAARRSFDVALEFATLGEYRLPEQLTAPSRRPRALPSGPNSDVPLRPRATRLRPATAAARRLRPDSPPRPISSHTGMRGMAFDASGIRPSRRGRTRAGSARPAPQPCLVADAGGSETMGG
jgi:hypothetical protein